jgi:hypothetical protein
MFATSDTTSYAQLIVNVFAAHERHPAMFTFAEFIDIINVNLNKFMVDNFFSNIRDKLPIYVTPEIISWCGYEGEANNQKTSFVKLLKRFTRGVDYCILSNSEYRNAYLIELPRGSSAHCDDNKSNSLYPDPITFKGLSTKHVLLKTSCFKKLAMMLQTPKGDDIREYYVNMEDTMMHYFRYQSEYLLKKDQIMEATHQEVLVRFDAMKIQCDALIEGNQELLQGSRKLLSANAELSASVEDSREEVYAIAERLDIAANERAPRPSALTKHETVIILRIGPNRYYIMCRQKNSIKTGLRSVMSRYPNAVEILTISYQPNSKNLYQLMRESDTMRIKTSGNSISLTDGYDDAQFIKDIKDLNESRFHVSLIDE